MNKKIIGIVLLGLFFVGSASAAEETWSSDPPYQELVDSYVIEVQIHSPGYFTEIGCTTGDNSYVQIDIYDDPGLSLSDRIVSTNDCDPGSFSTGSATITEAEHSRTFNAGETVYIEADGSASGGSARMSEPQTYNGNAFTVDNQNVAASLSGVMTQISYFASNIEPSINSIDASPDPVEIGETINITTNATDSDGSVTSATVDIENPNGNTVVTSGSMTQSGDTWYYEYDVPAQSENIGTWNYNVSVTDDAGDTVQDNSTFDATGTLQPDITLVNPSDGYQSSYLNNFDFEFDVESFSVPAENITLNVYQSGTLVDSTQFGNQNRKTLSTYTDGFNQTDQPDSYSWEVTADYDGGTVTETNTFTVSSESTSFNLMNPSDGQVFDAGIGSVNLEYEYNSDQPGTVELVVDGTVIDSFTSSTGSNTETYSYNVNNDQSYEWFVRYESDTGNTFTSSNRTFSVLNEYVNATGISPQDGAEVAYENRSSVDFEWESDANEDYITQFFLNGNLQTSNSYSRGLQTNTDTISLPGDSEAPLTHTFYFLTQGQRTGLTDQTNTFDVTVLPPELVENITLDAPANNSNYVRYSSVNIEATATTNDVRTAELYVEDPSGTVQVVESQTFGTDDRTNTSTVTLSDTSTYSNSGTYKFWAEINGQSTETRQFTIVDENINFTYISPDNTTLQEGLDRVNYKANVSADTAGTIKIRDGTKTVYTQDVEPETEGVQETFEIDTTVFHEGNAGQYDWNLDFVIDTENGQQTISSSDSGSYTIESLPTAQLISPDSGAFFRETPVTVQHEFGIDTTVNNVEYELLINGNTFDTGIGTGNTIIPKDYGTDAEGAFTWKVITRWSQ